MRTLIPRSHQHYLRTIAQYLLDEMQAGTIIAGGASPNATAWHRASSVIPHTTPLVRYVQSCAVYHVTLSLSKRFLRRIRQADSHIKIPASR